MPINILDIIVISFITISSILAFMDGVVSELLGIIGWVVALFATKLIFPFIFTYFENTINPNYKALVSVGIYISIFIVFVMFFSFFTQKVRRLIHTTDFKIADQYLGFIFGIIRGFIFAVLFYILLIWFISDPDDTPNWMLNAKFRPYLINTSSKMVSILPDTSAFDELKFIIKRNAETNLSNQKISSLKNIFKTEIFFETISPKQNTNGKLSDVEIQALKKTLKALRDAEEIKQKFIKDKD